MIRKQTQDSAGQPRARLTNRRGRALVECIVAVFLLGTTAISMGATVRGTLALSDDASLVSRAQSLSTTHVEDALVRPCGTGANGTLSLPRIDLMWQQSGSQRTTQMRLHFELERSPIAFSALPVRFSVDAGGVCP